MALVALMAAPVAAMPLDRYKDATVREAVTRVTQEAIAAHLAGKPYTPPSLPALAAPAGVFVTYSREGATRACWGTVHPTRQSAIEEIAANAVKALSHDYRQRAVSAHELAGLVAHVSIVGPLMPVADEHALQPRRHGLLVAAPGKGGVLLPGEALTAAWQVATCRRKAGLKSNERASMYRFETAVIGPIPFAELSRD